jgi:CBS domain-containing protein
MEDEVEMLGLKPPVAIAPGTTIRAAIALMLDRNIGVLLVVDAAGKLEGIFSERDLLRKVAGVQEDYGELPVRDFMTPRPEAVVPSATLNFVLHKMDGGGYRHVPVVDNGKPVGVVSVRDMLRHITKLCREGIASN